MFFVGTISLGIFIIISCVKYTQSNTVVVALKLNAIIILMQPAMTIFY